MSGPRSRAHRPEEMLTSLRRPRAGVRACSARRILRLTCAILGHPLAAHGPEIPRHRKRGVVHDERDRDEPEHGDADPDHTGRRMHAVMFANVAWWAQVTVLKGGLRVAGARVPRTQRATM